MAAAVISTKTILGGKRRVAGTRISVATIMSYFLHGYGVAEIQADYPTITLPQIVAARRYVAQHPEEFGLTIHHNDHQATAQPISVR